MNNMSMAIHKAGCNQAALKVQGLILSGRFRDTRQAPDPLQTPALHPDSPIRNESIRLTSFERREICVRKKHDFLLPVNTVCYICIYIIFDQERSNGGHLGKKGALVRGMG